MHNLRSSVLLLASTLIASTFAHAHTPLFDCFDNGDKTITCEGGFSDGASAEGVVIRLLDAQGKVLEQGELDAKGSITMGKPEGEYSVSFTAGADHSITVLGDDIVE